MRFVPALAVVASFGVAVALPAPTTAQPAPATQGIVTHVQTASELAAVCDPAWGGVPRLEAIAYCQGFLTSFGQYHALLYPENGPARPLFCVTVPGPTIAQSGIDFAAWAKENPRHATEPALDAMLRWAQGAFPCPASPTRRGATRSAR